MADKYSKGGGRGGGGGGRGGRAKPKVSAARKSFGTTKAKARRKTPEARQRLPF